MPIKKVMSNQVLKYILEDNKLVMGKVAYHKELAKNVDKVQGGGMYRTDITKRTVILFGDSYKFGPPDLKALQSAIDNWKVYTSVKQNHKLDARYKISIQTAGKGIILLN